MISQLMHNASRKIHTVHTELISRRTSYEMNKPSAVLCINIAQVYYTDLECSVLIGLYISHVGVRLAGVYRILSMNPMSDSG